MPAMTLRWRRRDRLAHYSGNQSQYQITTAVTEANSEAIVAIHPAPQLTNVERLVFAGGVKLPVPDQATQAVDDKTLTAADNATDMMCGPMTAILTATR
jgi:hypothetical protein